MDAAPSSHTAGAVADGGLRRRRHESDEPAQQDEPKKAQPRYNVNPEVKKAFELSFLPKFDKYYDLSYIGNVDAIQDLETAEKLFKRVVKESQELTEMLYEPTTTPEEKLEISTLKNLMTN